MAKQKTLNERDTKLVQWLNEAYAKEAELEVDLAAHITLTAKAAYKKRLQQHLKETREHKRAVARRIKALGGVAEAGPALPGVPTAVGEAAGKTVAAVKGQVGAARALVTPQPETHLRNAQEELREEHVEIAIYLRLETFASEVGDRETVTLAKRIRREEERMAKYLTAELPRLVKDVVKDEVPRDQRAGRSAPSRRRTTAARSTATTASRSRSTGAAASRSRAATKPATATRARATGTAASRSRATTKPAATTRSRATTKPAATTRSRAARTTRPKAAA